MYAHATYDDVVREVCEELAIRVDAVVAAGVDPGAVVIDPGFGFAKQASHNWELLARLDEIVALGLPVLVGASRKSFLGSLLATENGPRDATDREDATTAITTLAAQAGAWGVRVHSARPSADAVRVVAALRQTGRG
jgi:dihydropteroate synthase